MDYDEILLQNFGGKNANNLNSLLKNFDDSSDEIQNFTHSPYFDFNNISEINLPNNRTFKVLSINIQSIQAKYDALVSFLSILEDKRISFDAICIQETWLSNDTDTGIYNIPGFKLVSQGKRCCAHGGLFTYIHNTYNFTPRSFGSTSSAWEGQFIDITHKDFYRKVTLANIYRYPEDSTKNRIISTFIQELHPIIECLDRENSAFILAGDLNINLLEINERIKFQEYLDMFISRGIFPKITLPTRFSKKRATLLDHIFCKIPDGSSLGCSGIFFTKLSDHLPVFTCQEVFRLKKHKPKFINIQIKSNEVDNNFIAHVKTTIENTLFNP